MENRHGGRVRHDLEPCTTFWQREAFWIFSLLALHWLL